MQAALRKILHVSFVVVTALIGGWIGSRKACFMKASVEAQLKHKRDNELQVRVLPLDARIRLNNCILGVLVYKFP